MDDDEKLYWLKIVMGALSGLFVLVVIPQELVSVGLPVGWLRFLWLLGTWLLLPFPVVIIGLRLGLFGMTKKEKERLKRLKEQGEMLPKFKVKEAIKKFGGGKFILKTGVGAFFFIFLLTSTLLFTVLYPA